MDASKILFQRQALVEYKQLDSNANVDAISIPERPQYRRSTDRAWTIVLAVATVVLIPFLGYTLSNSSVQILRGNYDECRDICGINNEGNDLMYCSGKDLTKFPYWFNGGCVSSCGSYIVQDGKCIVSNIYSPSASSYLNNIKWQLISSSLLTILVAMFVMFLFRYATGFLVWLFLILTLVAFVGITIFFWALGSEAIAAAVFFTIFSVIFGLALFFFKKRINLVILLIREAAKAIFDMPQLFYIPVVAFIITLIIITLVTVSIMFMTTVTSLTYRQPYGLTVFSIVYTLVIGIWLSQFLLGIQHMVIAWAGATWYFSRNKSQLNRPIGTALSNVFKFHLGTAALGSAIISLIIILRAIIYSFVAMSRRARILNCFRPLLELLKYLSKIAYIMTGMHGQPFIKSGKRGVGILVTFLGNTLALNYIREFVFFMATLLIMLFSLALCAAIMAIAPGDYSSSSVNFWPYLIVGLVAAIASIITFTVFQTTIDTIYLSYCEDQILNDGYSRPYYMSDSLMRFQQESNNYYQK